MPIFNGVYMEKRFFCEFAFPPNGETPMGLPPPNGETPMGPPSPNGETPSLPIIYAS